MSVIGILIHQCTLDMMVDSKLSQLIYAIYFRGKVGVGSLKNKANTFI